MGKDDNFALRPTIVFFDDLERRNLVSTTEKIFTLEELQQYDGQNGKPTYIAFNGVVYDVSNSKLWRNGTHMNRHKAATDLTQAFANAPHKTDVLERHPRVGVLRGAVKEKAAATRSVPNIMKKFPFLKRHPHPMTVHFPIVFSISVTCCTVLYLISGWKGFDHTALCCLWGGTLFTPIAILTGYYTWRLNYASRIMKETLMKLVLPPVLFAVMLVTLVMRMGTPDILDRGFGENWLYILLTLSLFPLVSLIGWFGANLTFPIHEET